MASAATPLPYPPIHPLVNANDQGPAITVAAALCMIVSVLFFVSRLWIRFPWAELFWHDDTVTSVGVGVSVVQSILVMAAVGEGLGKKVWLLESGAAQRVEKMLYASSIFFVVSMCLGKLAIGLLFARLSSSGSKHVKISRLICAAIVAWGLVSLFLVAIRQDVLHPWGLSRENAQSTYTRWIIIEVLGAVLEVAMLAFSVFLVWNLQMSTHSKLTVVTGFAVRLPLFAIIALRLHAVHRALLGDGRGTSTSPTSPTTPGTVDPTFAPTLPEIYLQLEMHFNLIAATVPCLRIFLKNFQTGYLGNGGMARLPDMYNRSGGGGGGVGGTHLATKGSGKGAGSNSGLRMHIGSPMELRSVDRGETRSNVTHGNGYSGYNGSSRNGNSAVEGDDAASDGSGRRIVVRQTVDVAFE